MGRTSRYIVIYGGSALAFVAPAFADDCSDLRELFFLMNGNFSGIRGPATEYKNEFHSDLILEGARDCVVRLDDDGASFRCFWYYDDYSRSTSAYERTADSVSACVEETQLSRTKCSRADGSQSMTFKLSSGVRVRVEESGAIERQLGRRSISLTVSR